MQQNNRAGASWRQAIILDLVKWIPLRTGRMHFTQVIRLIAVWSYLGATVGFCQTEKLPVDTPNAGVAATSAAPDQPIQGRFRTETIRGKVVWLAEALKAQFGVSTVPESAERVLAIQTVEGALHPIVEDIRGRSFRIDLRLREMNVELLARRNSQHPMLQILKIYELQDGKRYEVDYWCDVCAIVMFEKGPCACCQDDNRLRKRLVE